MRKFVVGDICGDLDLLKFLMDRICPRPDDYFLFLGSYLGPGRDSKGVLDYLIDFNSKYSCNFLKGCYETIFQQILDTKDKNLLALWKSMGGDKVLQSYAVADDYKVVLEKGRIKNFGMPFAIPESHIRFLEKNLHLWYMDNNNKFVAFHAGPDTKNFQNPSQESITIGENGWWENYHLSNMIIVFGHIPFEKPFKALGRRGICLGAGQGGNQMCAWEANSDEFVVVKNANQRI